MNRFRLLRADEIDCRVSQINEKGLSLLLYKDARCDMNILDETVGPFRWQRMHSRDNANCTVSIFDPDAGIWVSKEDTGTESNTEAQKGLASDSFKRACFNWGIGRELYTAPFIWIPAERCTLKEGRNGKLACYDSFEVERIVYGDSQEITGLSIINAKTRSRVFSWQKGSQVVVPDEQPKVAQKPSQAAQKPNDEVLATRAAYGAAFTPTCAACGAVIDDRVHDYSVKRFGKPLCRDCQKRA